MTIRFGRSTAPHISLTVDGETRTIAEWARHLSVKRATLHSRYNCGWTDEAIVRTPVQPPRKKFKERRVECVTSNVVEAMRRIG